MSDEERNGAAEAQGGGGEVGPAAGADGWKPSEYRFEEPGWARALFKPSWDFGLPLVVVLGVAGYLLIWG